MVDVLMAMHWVCPRCSNKVFEIIETGPSAIVSRGPLGCNYIVNYNYIRETVGLPTMDDELVEEKKVSEEL